MHSDLFTEPAILFLTATASLFLFRMIKAPVVAGYLVAGMLIGPYGFKLLQSYHHIHNIAELGVILLLFTIGLEVSPTRLWTLRRESLIGGHLQVLLTSLIGGYTAWLFGAEINTAVVIGFFLALSSTAIVLRLLSEQDRMDSPHGRNALAILLLQDVIVVPIAIIIPLLGSKHGSITNILTMIGESIILMAAVILFARLVIPRLLNRVAMLRSREGFLLTLTTIIIGTAWLTSKIGLSPALGAFLAGLIISETEYKHLTLSEAIPFREMLLAVFFVSVGMLLNLKELLGNPLLPVAIALGVYLLKGLIISLVVKTLKYTTSTAVKTGAALGQVGEFSFVILLIAEKAELLGQELVQVLLASAAISILMTPLVISLVDVIYRVNFKKIDPEYLPDEKHATKHVVIIGFGLSGRMVAKLLKRIEIPYRVAEMNPMTVRNERRLGEQIHLGDASKPEILKDLQIEKACAAIIAISDIEAVRPVAIRIKQMAPNCHLIVRCRYSAHSSDFTKIGADDIVREDYEASVAIARALMIYLGQSEAEIEEHLIEVNTKAE